MQENKFFEESFRAYEKGIARFTFPHVLPIWLAYLKKFIERYAGKKIERTRDLFEQAVEKVPPKESRELFLLYAKFEEDYGVYNQSFNSLTGTCLMSRAGAARDERVRAGLCDRRGPVQGRNVPDIHQSLCRVLWRHQDTTHLRQGSPHTSG